MTFRGEQVRLEPVLIAGVSVWEAAAIITGLVPTVTETVMRLPRPARAVVVGLTGMWLTLHFEIVMRAIEDMAGEGVDEGRVEEFRRSK